MPTQLVSKGATHTRGKTTTTTTTTTTTQKKKSTGSVRTMARFAVAASAPAGAVTSSPGVQTRSRSKGGGGGGGGGYTRYRVSAKSSAKPVDGDLKKRKETIFTIPTILTLARMFAIPFVVLAYTREGPKAVAVCTILYVLACFTDWLDGYIARKTNTFSKFGAFLDPVSDKLMVTVILILVTYAAPPEGLCAQFPALVPFAAGGEFRKD